MEPRGHGSTRLSCRSPTHNFRGGSRASCVVVCLDAHSVGVPVFKCSSSKATRAAARCRFCINTSSAESPDESTLPHRRREASRMRINGTPPPHADRHPSRSVVGPLTIATRHAHSAPVHTRWNLTHRRPKASRSAARSRSPPTAWRVGRTRTWAVRTNRHMFQSDATIMGQIRVVKPIISSELHLGPSQTHIPADVPE